VRLTLAGKIVVYIAAVAGLCFLWTRLPHEVRHVNAPAALSTEPDARPAPTEPTGHRIGYAGSPPAVAAAALKAADVSLEAMESVPKLLDAVGSGALTGAVVDFPSVVYASRKGTTRFHTVLLVSWRTGADAVVVRSGGPWRPDGRTDFTPATSGEYLARLVLDSARYSPQEKAAGRKWLGANPPDAGADAWDAAAGRLDRMSPVERGWPVYRAADDEETRMPDVLIVNTKWARNAPVAVTSLVRAWRRGQDAMTPDAAAWKDYASQESQALGIPESEVLRQMRPAPLEDQLAFAGLAEKGMKYTELVLRQLAVLEPGPRPPSADFAVLLDPRPLADAVASDEVERGKI
jgi:ABC-type nitrate/sulfonate/bicarbonate transport system substrate-binding protein